LAHRSRGLFASLAVASSLVAGAACMPTAPQPPASAAGPTEGHASGLSMPVTDPGRLTGDFFADGVVYLADYDHRTGGLGRILRFDEASKTTQVLAGSVGRPTDAVIDRAGNVYFTEHISGALYQLTNGVVTQFVAGFSRPQNLAIDATSTTLYVSDATSDDLNNKIYAVDLATRVVTTVAGNGSRTGAKVCDDIARPATSVSVNKPIGITVDGDRLYIASQFDDLVYRVDLASGLLSRYAGSCTTTQVGDHGAATAAYVQKPQGLDVDGAGNLYVLQYNGAVRRVDAISGQITTVYALSTKAGSNSDLSFDATDGSFWLSAQAESTSVLVKVVKV
jgi:sugar lactone lactonase YvrE